MTCDIISIFTSSPSNLLLVESKVNFRSDTIFVPGFLRLPVWVKLYNKLTSIRQPGTHDNSVDNY